MWAIMFGSQYVNWSELYRMCIYLKGFSHMGNIIVHLNAASSLYFPLSLWIIIWEPFQYKDQISRYRDCHYEDKTVLKLSYVMGNSTSTLVGPAVLDSALYWNAPWLIESLHSITYSIHTPRCDMAFIEPMHRNKPNITYLHTYTCRAVLFLLMLWALIQYKDDILPV